MLTSNKIIYNSQNRTIDTCTSYGAHLWVPNDTNDQENLIYMKNVWVGVVVDPPHWYNLTDWLNAGCAVHTDGYFTKQAVEKYLQQRPYLPASYIQGLISQELQPNITW